MNVCGERLEVTSRTTVVIAPVDAVTGDDIVVTRFEFAVTRLAPSGRNAVAAVTRLDGMVSWLDTMVSGHHHSATRSYRRVS
jgi:hypothetical protein